MTWEAWYTLGTIALILIAVASHRINIDTAMIGGLTVLLLGDALAGGGILPPSVGIAGFAHPSIIMIGALFVVAAGLRETGAMDAIANRLLGRPRTVARAQIRLMVPVAVMSAFMNNTPIVAMYLPIVGDWARKARISASKLYMPLSFAATLGGKCTLIGTSSNIVLMSLYLRAFSDPELGSWVSSMVAEPGVQKQFWGVAVLGLPTTIAGILLIVLCSRRLLPERRASSDAARDSRRYQVEMIVQADAPIIGRSIEEAGLRHLPGLYLTKIERGGKVIHAVSPAERLEADDRLAFAGILDSVVDLRRIRGLVPATDQVEKVTALPQLRTLVEAVVSHNSPLVGQTVRSAKFRTKYNAAIIAVHRNGEVVNAKVGDIYLHAGDTLLLDTHDGFLSAYRGSDDFYLISQVEGSRPIRHDRATIALGVLALLVGMLTLTRIPPLVVALVCSGLMVLTRCVTGTVARTSVNWQVLLVIGAALGIGASLQETRAAEHLADGLLALCAGFSPHAMLLVIFVTAAMFAQVVTNNGAAVLMFPITMSTARELGVSPEPFVFTLMIAAGSTYLSPVGYQTNLMVYGPGGYRFFDYARLGLPLTVAVAVICTVLAPIAFPFAG